MDAERIRRALDSLVYLPHLKERALHATVSPVGNGGGGSSGEGAAGGKGRVWDRGDLFRRLQSFKPATWFCKPEAIGPVECARRGWLNTAPDLLTCEFCKAKVSCPIPPQLLPEEAQETAARYAKQLSEAHDAACPWRTNCCAASLLQFPPLTQEAALEDFRRRSAALQQLVCLPPLAAEAYDSIAATRRAALDALLLHGPGRPRLPAAGQQQQQQADAAGEVRAQLGPGVVTWNTDSYEARLRLLALCGWDLRLVSAAAQQPGGPETGGAGSSSSPRGAAAGAASTGGGGSHVGPECSALACSLCGAKAGLWTFFPSCRPRVQAAAGSGRAAALRAAAAGGAAGRRTIAGGIMASAAAVQQPPSQASSPAGPFGAAHAAVPLFGPPSTATPPAPDSSQRPHNIAGGSADAPAAAGDTPLAAVTGEAAPEGAGAEAGEAPAGPFGAGPAAAASAPLFGLAALRSSSQALEASAKRKQGAASEGSSSPASEPAEKRPRGEGDGGVEEEQAPGGGAAAGAAEAVVGPLQYCSTEALQRYREMHALPLDPLALHRRFCPWVNSQPPAGSAGAAGQPARCGWRWCLQQLVPGAEDGTSLLESQGGDPAKLLRAVLRKVDVHK